MNSCGIRWSPLGSGRCYLETTLHWPLTVQKHCARRSKNSHQILKIRRFAFANCHFTVSFLQFRTFRLYGSTYSLVVCVCVGARPSMTSTIHNSVRRLIGPESGLDSLWAFKYFLS